MLSAIQTVKGIHKFAYVVVAWMFLFSSSSADEMKLSQLSEGFNAEQKYMASCFACHSTGAAGRQRSEQVCQQNGNPD